MKAQQAIAVVKEIMAIAPRLVKGQVFRAQPSYMTDKGRDYTQRRRNESDCDV